jgi:hypothetical protein
MTLKTKVIYLAVGASGLVLGCLAKSHLHTLGWGPMLRVEPTVVDLGQVGTGQVYTGTFTVENRGRKPLTLSALKVSCTCTVAQMCESPLAPGQRASIKLHVRAPNDEARFGSYLTLKTNDPAQTQVNLHIQGQAVSVLNIAPLALLFGDVAIRDLPITKRFHVRAGKLAKPGMLDRLEATSTAKDIQCNVSRSGDEAVVDVTIASDMPMGALQDNIKLALKACDDYTVHVPVVAEIKGDYAIRPSSLVFGKVRTGTSAVCQCSITPVPSGTTIEILPESHSDKWDDLLSLHIERTADGAIIKATLTPGSERGVLERKVRIKLTPEDKSRPQYAQIPLLAAVSPSGSRQAMAIAQPENQRP